MSSQRPVYIPRRRKAVHASNNTVPAASRNTGENYQTRRQLQKQQQPRFHGAFTGGFSAGYFNTVGTKEGWMPSQTKKKDQRLEDFMDDEDHANWGGPTRLRDEYGVKNAAATNFATTDHGDPNGDASSSQSSRAPFLPSSMLEITHQTVGPRLLRRLGWREGRIAIVPDNATTTKSASRGTGTGAEETRAETDDNTLENLAKVHLSRRKLRKIQLQSSRMKLPPPKLDQCGLGFEPHKDAPEFQRYREKRQQQARDRASYNTRTNVYRISDVAAPADGDRNSHANGRAANSQHPHNGNAGEYMSYETAEDFVGKRSAAGFALRDDEDDAYDNDDTYDHRSQLGNNAGGPQSARLNGFRVGDEYNTEVYEHESSDDDGHISGTVPTISRPPKSRADVDKHSQSFETKKSNSKAVDVGDMFSAWAGTDQLSSEGKALSTPPAAALTSDGQPPLAGFVLGDSMDRNTKRYPGPDIPRDYTIQRHEFGEHENPFVLEAISNAVKLEQKEEQRSQVRQQWESQRQNQPTRDESSRPLSSNFSSLADAMKRRFTSSTEQPPKNGVSTTSETTKTFPAGLHMPRPVEKTDDGSKTIANPEPKSTAPNITITRTVTSFFPNPLVCKRFRVPLPTNARRNTGLIATDATKKKSESAYFESEILGNARQQRGKTKKMDGNIGDAMNDGPENQPNQEEEPKGIDRPSIENLRSIFEASSDESSSSEDEDSDDSGDDRKRDMDPSLKDDSSKQKFVKSPGTLPKDDAPTNATKEGTGEESRAIVEFRPSAWQEDEDGNSSSRSSGSESESSMVEAVSSRKRRKEKRRRKHRHHRKRDKRKRPRSSDRGYDSDRSSSREEDEEERRRDRRSRDSKRRKKKKYSSSSSSRHKSRKRQKAEKR